MLSHCDFLLVLLLALLYGVELDLLEHQVLFYAEQGKVQKPAEKGISHAMRNDITELDLLSRSYFTSCLFPFPLFCLIFLSLDSCQTRTFFLLR